MSLQRALKAIDLNKTDRIPRWIGVPRHAEFLERLTGLDPTAYPREVSLKAIELLNLDVAQYYNHLEHPGIPEGETGEVQGTKVSRFDGLGTTQGGGLTRWEQPERHIGIDEVLEYDVEQHPSNRTEEAFLDGISSAWNNLQAHQHVIGDHAWVGTPVDWYNTVFMWGITTFGWQAFLTTVGLEPERYGQLLERFIRITRRYFSAAARIPGLRVAQAHDDLCMTQGPVCDPRWYRKYVFPLYPKVLAPLKERGVKVIYRGDGNADEFIDDLAAAGFDGFLIRSETDMGRIAKTYGSSHLIIGNISTTILTLKGKYEIYAEVERCVRQAGDCPGYFFHVSGEIPYNVPADNLFYLFEALDKFGRR